MYFLGQRPHHATGQEDVKADYSWRRAGGERRGCKRSESLSWWVQVEEEEEGDREEEGGGRMGFWVPGEEEAGR